MSFSLEHRSSLRKLSFPDCCEEALTRLQAQSVNYAQGKQPAPKEMEVVLEVIEEFVFNFGTKPSKKAASNPPPGSALQELHMLQVLLDYFSNFDGDPYLMLTVFTFLFMDPIKHSGSGNSSSSNAEKKKTKRTVSLSKLVALAMGLGNAPILRCAGIWMHNQGPTSERCLQLTELLIQEHVLLIRNPVGALAKIPDISPIFAANFTTAATALYDTSPPPSTLLKIMVSWFSSNPLLSLTCVQLSFQSNASASSSSAASSIIAGGGDPTPILGLARWTILAPLVPKVQKDHLAYSQLHLSILETLVETRALKDSLKPEFLPTKKVSSLIQHVNHSLSDGEVSPSPAETTACLDRLGQFLQAITESQCCSGKTVDIISALKKLPRNRLIQLYVSNFLTA